MRADIDPELLAVMRRACEAAGEAGIVPVFENLATLECAACQGTIIAAEFGALGQRDYLAHLAWCGHRAMRLVRSVPVCAFHHSPVYGVVEPHAD